MIFINTSIDEVSIEIESNSSNASSGLDSLALSIGNLETILSSSLQRLNTFSSSISNLQQSASNFSNTNFSNFSSSLLEFSNIPIGDKFSELISQLKKLPEITKQLDDKSIDEFVKKITRLVDALSPVADKISTISVIFNNLPKNVTKTTDVLDKLDKSLVKNNSTLSKSSTRYLNFAASIKATYAFLKNAIKIIGGFVDKSNAFIENQNLFTVSMGKSADSAKKFVDNFSSVLNIDPSNVTRYMSLFNNLATGFGISGKNAEIMSKNLTQLSYDISSFLNIPIEEAMTKIKSGFSGEIEPMRAIGVALDQATLQQTAYTLGLTQNVNEMTRAQKTQLLYYQMMKSTTKLQGDFSRTLLTPANLLKVLREQFTILARSIGNIFIPIIQSAIPFIIALSQVLSAVAQQVANFFGYEIPKIDYSGITDMTIAIEDEGNAADETAKKLNKMLNKFDELNVIEFDKGSSSSIGGGSTDNINTGELDIPIYDYDALADKATIKIDKIKKKIQEVIDKVTNFVKKFDSALKGIGVTIAGIFVISKIAKFISSLNKLAKAWLGIDSITAISYTKVVNAIPAWIKWGVAILGVATVATTAYSAFYDFFAGTKSLQEALLNILPVFALVEAAIIALMVKTNPVGAAIAAVAVALGAVVAGMVAYKNQQKDLEEQNKLKDLFDGQGQSMESILNYYQELGNEITIYSDKLKSNSEEIENNNKLIADENINLDLAITKLGLLGDEADKTDFDTVINSFNSMGNAAITNMNLAVAGITSQIEYQNKLGLISDEERERFINNQVAMQVAQGNAVEALKLQMNNLTTDYQNQNITLSEYQTEMAKLTSEMKRLAGEANTVDTAFDDLVKDLSYNDIKINLGNSDKALELVENLTEAYNTQSSSIKENKKLIEDAYQTQIIMAGDNTEAINEAILARDTLLAGLDEQQKKLDGNYAGTFKTIKYQIKSSGTENVDEMKKVVDATNTVLDKIGDVELDGKGKELWEGLLKGVENDKQNAINRILNVQSDTKHAAINGLNLTGSEEKELNNKQLALFTFDEPSIIKFFSGQSKKLGGSLKSEYIKSFNFSAQDQKTISQLLTDPLKVKNSDLVSVLNHIQSTGKQIKDAEGNSVEFTDEEILEIANSLTNPLVDPFENPEISEKVIKFVEGLQKDMADTIDKESVLVEDASTRTGAKLTGGLGNSIINTKNFPITATKGVSKEVQGFMDKIDGTQGGINLNKSLGKEIKNSSKLATREAEDLKDTIETTINGIRYTPEDLADSLIEAFRKIGDAIGSAFGSVFDGFGDIVNNLLNIDWFANGGFPTTGQFFYARESGPELVGTIGNKSAVANNDQIAYAMEEASYRGVSRALQENSGNYKQPINVNIGNRKVYSGYGEYLQGENNMYGTSIV